MGLNILAWAKAKKYTDQKTSQTAGLHREIVQSLPLTGDETVIYMVPITGSGDDNYNEYMWINNAYELIGNTRVDLTDYYNKTQVDAALSAKANTSDIPTALSSLTDDATHRLVTDTEKSTWNGKASSSTSLAGYGITDAYTKSEVDTKLSYKADEGDSYRTMPLFLDAITVPTGSSILTLPIPSQVSKMHVGVYAIFFYCLSNPNIYFQWSPNDVGMKYLDTQDCWKVSVNNMSGSSKTISYFRALVFWS